MDVEKIGKFILSMRKQNNLTQAELAEKLNVSDKAISKWEQGQCLPDIQQIESITNLFNISFDDFFKAEPKKTRSFAKRDVVKNKQRKKFNPKEWYRLDNAAKVYPPEAESDWNSVFRISAVMKEKIDRVILNKALEDTIDRFPSLMVTIKKGLFWYYFERLEKAPTVENGMKYPCSYIPLDGKHYLFRVTADEYRLGVEIFHSITDGTGATVFLNTVVARYYELKFGAINEFVNCKNVLDKVRSEEIEDTFSQYAEKRNYAKRVANDAFLLKGTKISRPQIIHLIINSDMLRKKAKELNATVTEFLTTLLIQAIEKRKIKAKSKKPIIIQIPINLRKIFPSDTLRNFSYFFPIEVTEQNLPFEKILEIVKSDIKKGTDKEILQQNINVNMRDERNIAIRVVPLAIKNIGLNFARMILGDKSFTIGFSNLGNVQAPKELEDIVDRMEFILKEPKNGGLAFSGISYNNKCVLTFARSIMQSDIEREFTRLLQSYGLKIFAETNGGEPNESL